MTKITIKELEWLTANDAGRILREAPPKAIKTKDDEDLKKPVSSKP